MRTLADVGVPGQQVDVLNGGDVDPSGRLLTVAEIQQAFRELRERQAARSATGRERATPNAAWSPRPPHTETGSGAPLTPVLTARRFEAPHTAIPPRGDTAAATPHSPDESEAPQGGDRLDPAWTAVVAAHSGAGASVVALAIADAYSAAGQASRVIETAHPARSGLLAAAAAELGLDPSGAWRRGSRQLATVYRRAGDLPPQGWPEQADADPVPTVVDLGLPAPANLTRLGHDRPQIVVVCRVSVPGMRLADQLLSQLGGAPVCLAAVGAGRRWPGAVSASLGAYVRQLHEVGLIAAIPQDRRLQVVGPTASPLPKPLLGAGQRLLRLVGASRPAGHSTAARQTVRHLVRAEGATR